MPVRIVVFDEDKIDKKAAEDALWDALPCNLEGDDYGVHTMLTFEVTTNFAGDFVCWKVIDCDRKGEPR